MAACERGDFSLSVDDEDLRLCGGGCCLTVSVGGTGGRSREFSYFPPTEILKKFLSFS